MRIRSSGCGSRMLFAECDPFCALQARWTVSRSRPPLRLLRTGEHDEKLTKLHHLRSTSLLRNERIIQVSRLREVHLRARSFGGSDTPDKCEPCPLGTSSRSGATACMECLPGMFNDYGILESVSCQLGFFSDGLEPKMCQQRALGSYRRLVPAPEVDPREPLSRPECASQTKRGCEFCTSLEPATTSLGSITSCTNTLGWTCRTSQHTTVSVHSAVAEVA